MAYQTDTHSDKVAPGSTERRDKIPFRPDITIYPCTSEAKEAYKLQTKEAVSTTPDQDDVDGGSLGRSSGSLPGPLNVDPGILENTSIAYGHETSNLPTQPLQQSVGSGTDAVASRTGDGVVQHEPLLARMSWANAELIIEVKGNKQKGPFSATVKEVPKDAKKDVKKDVNGDEVLPDGREHKLARGQATHYGVGIFNRQHRQHMFILSIVYNVARFIYFDRSGAVYSQEFDYYKDPVTFATFLYRFSKMTPSQRGHDPTVSLASKHEHDLFRNLWETYPKSTMAQYNSVPISAVKHAGTPGWPVYALNIYAQWSDESKSLPTNLPFTSRRCLVGRPDRVSESLVGRGTRGFVAYDLEDKRIVYVKDSWRAISEDLPSEYNNYQQIYRRLAAKGHKLDRIGLLTVLAGGDVRPALGSTVAGQCTAATFQNTRAQEFLNNGHLPTEILMRRHQRLVFKEVCRPLEDFKDARELCDVLLQALCAHSLAWTSADIMHRDVSASNILIHDTPDGPSLGILADWDLAKTKRLLSNQKATQPSRSGTWQFLSALRQCFPETPWQLSDDLESFMHVLNWIALKYLKHDSTYEEEKGIKTQSKWFHDVYDTPAPEGTTARMDERHIKLSHIVAGKPFVKVRPLHSDNPLNVLLDSLAQLFQEHYQSDEIRAIWTTPSPQPSPALAPVTSSEPVGPTILDVLNMAYEDYGSPPIPPASTNVQPLPRETEKRPKATSPLTKHIPMIRLFHAALNSRQRWSEMEKTPNQVPSWSSGDKGTRSAAGSSADSRTSINKSGKRTRDSTGLEGLHAEAQHSGIRRSVAERNLRSSSRDSSPGGRSESPSGRGRSITRSRLAQQAIPPKPQPGPSRLGVTLDTSAAGFLPLSSRDGSPIYPGSAPLEILPATSSSSRDASRSVSRSSRPPPAPARGRTRGKQRSTNARRKGKGKAKQAMYESDGEA
ncbi:hypothetical protein C8Q78DRAFT_728722 [Trametes maxima]|nr:hypothetical protein C8Q78DRAFT_728722 [Trametes maxima]